MERVVESKQLRARDEEIQGHLSHILSHKPKPDASVPTRAHEVQDHPPGLDNGSWASSAPPPVLPHEFVKLETSSAAGHALQLESKDLRVQGGPWKLLKKFPVDPRTERPSVGSAVCHGNGIGRELCGIGFRKVCEVSI